MSRNNFTLRIYKDLKRNPVLSDISDITISGITLISKNSKFGEVCFHKSNQRKFKYTIELSKTFNYASGSHSSPNLSFKGEYIDIIVKGFPRYPAFYQEYAAARGCLDGFKYTNYLNKGFPHQLLYRTIEFLNP